jgi:hypothetical protein
VCIYIHICDGHVWLFLFCSVHEILTATRPVCQGWLAQTAGLPDGGGSGQGNKIESAIDIHMCVINTTIQMRTRRRLQIHGAGRTPRKAPLKTSVFWISDCLVSICYCCFLRGSTNPAAPPPSTYPRHIHSRGGGRAGYPIGAIFCVPMTPPDRAAPRPTPGPGPLWARTRRGMGGVYRHGYAKNCTYGVPRAPPAPRVDMAWVGRGGGAAGLVLPLKKRQ